MFVKYDISYHNNVVRFKLIQDLTDLDIKEHILGEQDKSLEEMVKAIEAKECGKLTRQTINVYPYSKGADCG